MERVEAGSAFMIPIWLKNKEYQIDERENR